MQALKTSNPVVDEDHDGGAAEASLRRRWVYLLPAVFVTYSLAYLDRANYGFGAAAGLAATLRITSGQSSLLAGLFFAGYFAFQLPGAILARKRSASRLVFFALIPWGILSALTGVIHAFWALALIRFLLGVAESCIFPAMLFLLTRWFTRAERSRANTFLILGNPVTVLWMSAVTGYLIQAVGWQRTFLYEGIPSVLWAFAWLAMVKDTPEQARWLTPGAVSLLNARLAEEQIAVAPEMSLRTALLRPDVLLLCAIYFFWSLGVYGFVLWLPTIVHQGSELSMGRTGLLAAVPYAAAILAMLYVAQRADKSQQRKTLVGFFLLFAGIALAVSFLAHAHFAIAFAALIVAAACMYAPYGPFFAIVPERLPRSVLAEVLALINSIGALGGFFGSYFVGWLQGVTGNSRAGYLLMSVSMLCAAALMLSLADPKPARQAAATMPATAKGETVV
jgi:sugar phosphate permease